MMVIDRRQLLRSIGGISTLALAGCLGENSSSDTSADDEETSDESTPSDGSSGDDEHGAPPVAITIHYSGEWAGSVGHEGRQVSVDGYGQRTITMDGYPRQVSVSIQKRDEWTDELRVEVAVDGETIASQGTTAEYGVVTMSVPIE